MRANPPQACAPDAPGAANGPAELIGENADEGDPAHYDDEPPSRPDTPGTSDTPDIPGAVELSVSVDDPQATPHAPDACGWLSKQMANALGLLGISRGSLDIVIVGDELMARLHDEYKNVPGTTDVLTFDLSEAEMTDKQDSVEAELVLCFDEASRQASERGHEPRQEMLLYAVHGLMHLLDEDDQDPQASARMHRREDDLLEQMGQGRLYGTDPQS